MSSERIKSSMSSEERARRRSAVGKAASERIAKSEQLNFRLEEQTIVELQEMAFEMRMPLGTMIREWVLERLTVEKLGDSNMSGKALHMLDEIHAKLETLEQLLIDQPKPIQQQRKTGGRLNRSKDEAGRDQGPSRQVR